MPAHMRSQSGLYVENVEYCTADAHGPNGAKNGLYGAASADWTMEQNIATTRHQSMKISFSGRFSQQSTLQ